MSPVFFFSYARADRSTSSRGRLNAHDGDSCVDDFYGKLSDEVASLTARSAEGVGFFDRDHLDLGTPWPQGLMGALRSTRVMVALFSPTYFSRPACGREFAVFRARQEELMRTVGSGDDYRILPVLWVRPDVTDASIPSKCAAYIRTLQNIAPGMPECYSQLGLKRMFDLDYKIEVNRVCHKIADRIYSIVTSGRSLPGLDELDFNGVPSAFHDVTPEGHARPVDRRKREVRVYYLIPTRTEWSAVSGENISCFRDVREQARPFAEAAGVTVGAATEEGIGMVKPERSVIHEPLPNDLAEALTATQGSMTTPLVVFDRRAIRVPVLHPMVSSYVARNFENTGFVTAGGDTIAESELNSVCAAKIGALPRLHNWSVPRGRGDYEL
jgi:hypothetical protein